MKGRCEAFFFAGKKRGRLLGGVPREDKVEDLDEGRLVEVGCQEQEEAWTPEPTSRTSNYERGEDFLHGTRRRRKEELDASQPCQRKYRTVELFT